MCAHKPTVRLTPNAKADFQNILAHTRRMWGGEQKADYRMVISGALRRLGEFPDIGEDREDLFQGCRMLSVGQHVVFYHRPNPSELVVLRIVHTRQDIQVISLLPEP